MKIKIILLLITFLSNANASFQFSTQWSLENKKELIVNCQKNTLFCENTCNDFKSCSFPETICRNCISSQVFLTHLLEEMGHTYVNTGVLVAQSVFLDFVSKDLFTSLTSHTVYNQLYEYDAKELKAKFQSLCPGNKTEYPVVLLELEAYSKRLKKIRYVLCAGSIYEMSDHPELIMGHEQQIQNNLF